MEHKIKRGTLLIASFLTLVAAGAGFATRGAAGPAWAKMGIGPGEFGSIMGAGFIGFFVTMFGSVCCSCPSPALSGSDASTARGNEHFGPWL